MDWLQALILGLIQGLTEYLPVSSSGHLAIGSYLFGINGEDNLAFTIVVHVATVLSTFVILWSEIDWIFRGLFKFKMNDETKYFLNIVVSMIPIGIVGVFFKDTGDFRLRAADCGLYASAHRLVAHVLLFRKASRERKHLLERRAHHRFGASLRCDARSVAFGLYHRHRFDAGQQERKDGSVLVPDGDSTYFGRSAA